jgi:hypothetical protein
MNKDDKYRVVGKLVAINSDRFTVELLMGIENFNINGFDDIHYFAQVNSYVILPYQNYHIVAEVISVREKDAGIYINNPIEQILNKAKSVKYIDIIPIGTIKSDSKCPRFDFGVSVYPSLYSDVLYVKKSELDCIFNVNDAELLINDDCKEDEQKIHKNNSRLSSLSIGKSTIFENYNVKINIDRFFGSHSAILGNTGSGKSCTIASMIQGLYKKKEYSAVGSTFVLFDVNGEYKQAFSGIEKDNDQLKVKNFTLDDVKEDDDVNLFTLPHWFLNIDEWALLLQASEKTQLPILRNALGLAAVFSTKDDISQLKNHILATCITQILRDETSSPSKKDRIISILQKFNTDDVYLSRSFTYIDRNDVEHNTVVIDVVRGVEQTLPCDIRNCLTVHYGELKGLDNLIYFFEQKDDDGKFIFLSDDAKMPSYQPYTKFDFNILEHALDIALLYEEAHGNRQIRDYCSSMLTRFKSLKERTDYNFLKNESPIKSISSYRNKLIGIIKKKDVAHYFKRSQITIIDLSSVEDEVVEIVSCVISRIIYEALKQVEPRNSFPVNIVLEEAHRYISFDQQRLFLRANKIFENIAKEGRKFGMFLMVSSQRPSELSKTVLSQCSNFVVHRIQNPEDLNHIRQITPHISEAILKRLPSIPTQHALIFGQAVNLPATFKVNEAVPLPLSDNNKISINWFRSHEEPIKIAFKK